MGVGRDEGVAVEDGGGIATGVGAVVPDDLEGAPGLTLVGAAAQDEVDVAVIPYGGGSSVCGGVEPDVGTPGRGVISLDMEALAGLKASFEQLGAMGFDAVAQERYPQVERIVHVHHAGNSSGIVDGAAAVLIGSEAAAKAHGLKPRARIVATALSGADPTIMLTGPMPATQKALAKAGLTIEQIDLFEVNEAFAAVPMKFMKDLKVPHEKVNVNGGAIAMGHPLGATGAMILGTLIDELHRRGLRYGLATLCVGGGMGIATIVERL